MDSSLPPGGSGNLLAIGEHHGDTAHLKLLGDNLPQLIQHNNVGTVGFEESPLMNVFFWAYRDGKLPVSHDKSADYLKSLMGKSGDDYTKSNGEAKSDIVVQGLDKGIKVVAFDARHPANSFSSSDIVQEEFAEINSHPGLAEKLRNDPQALDTFLTDYKFSGATNKNLAGYIYVAYEANELIRKNPEYAKRMSEIDALIDKGKKAGLGEDAISATIFSAMADPGKNAITISGANHIEGVVSKDPPVQGTFNQHLREAGDWKVQEVIMPGGDTVAGWIFPYSPGGSAARNFKENCQIRSSLKIYALDNDMVMDASTPSAELASHITTLRKIVAQFSGYNAEEMLGKAGMDFTCNSSTLPDFHSQYKGEKADPLLNASIADAAAQLHGAVIAEPGIDKIEKALKVAHNEAEKTDILNGLSSDPDVQKAFTVMAELARHDTAAVNYSIKAHDKTPDVQSRN